MTQDQTELLQEILKNQQQLYALIARLEDRFDRFSRETENTLNGQYAHLEIITEDIEARNSSQKRMPVITKALYKELMSLATKIEPIMEIVLPE